MIKNGLVNAKVLLPHNTHLNVNLTRLSQHVDEQTLGQSAYFEILDKKHFLALGDTLPLQLVLPVKKSVYALPRSAFYRSNTIYKISNNELLALKVKRVGQTLNQQGLPLILFESNMLLPKDTVLITRIPNPVSGQKVEISQLDHGES